MNIFLPWLLGAIILLVGFLMLNYKQKWLDKWDVEDAWNEGYIIVYVFAVLLWPITIIIGIIMGVGYFLYKNCIPD